MPTTLERRDGYWAGLFQAMASPCEVFVEGASRDEARSLVESAAAEARRIETKFSRYRDDNIVHAINNSDGRPVAVDQETARLLDYAAQCYELSDGKFDITSGVLREVWKFDGSDRLPSSEAVAAVLTRVGWPKVSWAPPRLTLPRGMEIDFGGIGKEYAVDRAALLLRAQTRASVLVNFGGDLVVTGPRHDGNPWRVGIDDPGASGRGSIGQITIRRGALATSGDARRYLLKDGVRYSHILDPRTGWPVPGAPHGVTVAADTCVEAGMLATFAMLEGAAAETFLREQRVQYWIA